MEITKWIEMKLGLKIDGCSESEDG